MEVLNLEAAERIYHKLKKIIYFYIIYLLSGSPQPTDQNLFPSYMRKGVRDKKRSLPILLSLKNLKGEILTILSICIFGDFWTFREGDIVIKFEKTKVFIFDTFFTIRKTQFGSVLPFVHLFSY